MNKFETDMYDQSFQKNNHQDIDGSFADSIKN